MTNISTSRPIVVSVLFAFERGAAGLICVRCQVVPPVCSVPVLVPAAACGPMSSPLPGSSPRTPVRRRVVAAVRSPSPPPSSASSTHSEETVLTVTLLKRSVGVVVGRRLRAQSVYRRALATPLSAQVSFQRPSLGGRAR